MSRRNKNEKEKENGNNIDCCWFLSKSIFSQRISLEAYFFFLRLVFGVFLYICLYVFGSIDLMKIYQFIATWWHHQFRRLVITDHSLRFQTIQFTSIWLCVFFFFLFVLAQCYSTGWNIFANIGRHLIGLIIPFMNFIRTDFQWAINTDDMEIRHDNTMTWATQWKRRIITK